MYGNTMGRPYTDYVTLLYETLNLYLSSDEIRDSVHLEIVDGAMERCVTSSVCVVCVCVCVCVSACACV